MCDAQTGNTGYFYVIQAICINADRFETGQPTTNWASPLYVIGSDKTTLITQKIEFFNVGLKLRTSVFACHMRYIYTHERIDLTTGDELTCNYYAIKYNMEGPTQQQH